MIIFYLFYRLKKKKKGGKEKEELYVKPTRGCHHYKRILLLKWPFFLTCFFAWINLLTTSLRVNYISSLLSQTLLYIITIVIVATAGCYETSFWSYRLEYLFPFCIFFFPYIITRLKHFLQLAEFWKLYRRCAKPIRQEGFFFFKSRNHT